jgi:DNA primase
LDVASVVQRKMRFPDGVTIAPLTEWPLDAARYVLRRGITVEQITRWRLGYAESGRLAGRIVIPIWGSGAIPDLLHYTARTYRGSPAKYKSAQRSEGFDDAAVFGEARWPELASRRVVAVLEGALNALALERVMPEFPVASLFGSNVTVSHLCKLSTFGKVIVLTDSDLAGDRAAEKLMYALQRHVEVVRPTLPPRVDVNDLERQDPDALRALLCSAV